MREMDRQATKDEKSLSLKTSDNVQSQETCQRLSSQDRPF